MWWGAGDSLGVGDRGRGEWRVDGKVELLPSLGAKKQKTPSEDSHLSP